MNRLELCQRTAELAGIPTASFLTTVNLTGEARRVVRWVDDALEQILQSHLWNFQWEQATVTIQAGTNATAGTIPPHRYVRDSAYVGTRKMDDFVPWQVFRTAWETPLIGNGEPSAWSIRPDKAFVVNSKPLADLTITVERYRNPVAMTADDDVPPMPTEHHLAIVYKALLLYANFEEAGVTRATAEEELGRHLSAMGMNELPSLLEGSALC